ncbi:MAG: metallophosphoesterase [Pirellulaceae bacterium]
MDVQKVKRRGFFAMLAVAFSYILYLVAENNRWIILTHRARSFEPGIQPVSRESDREISLLLIGDTGKGSEQRIEVMRSIKQQPFVSDIDAVLLMGDNFYEAGVVSVDDPKFKIDFEDVFAGGAFDCPFYPTLGNHDYAGNIDAQVEYSQRSDRWKMPALYYKVRHESEGQTLDLFVIDSNTIVSGQPSADDQIAWLDSELAASDAQWKIVMGHHPIITGGEHGPSQIMQDRFAPLFIKHNVDIYAAGHEHDLQMLDSNQGWLQVISGSGSKIRSTTWIDSTQFAAAKPGFAWLLVQNGRLSISYFSCDGHLFTHELPRKSRRALPQAVASTT